MSQTTTVPMVGVNTGITAVQSYQYDSLNRLKDATEMVTPTGGSQEMSWRQAFVFDRYGNRNFDEANTTTLQKNCGTPPNQTVCPADVPKVNPSVNPLNNRFSSGQGWSYDAAGNTTADPEGRQFTYDAENKQVKVETLDANGNPVNTIGVYEHDGDGRRVKKIVPGTGAVTVFVYDAASKLVAEYSTQAASTQDAKVAYLTNDHLGSPRINTDANGAVTARHDYHPFGEEVFTAQRTQGLNYAGDSVRQKFTSYERDNETDLDFAQARYYNKLYGRFTSPDEAFIDQFEENPQSWNLYIYVRNNPLNLTDPLGTSANCPPGKVCTLDEDGNVISEEDDNDPIIIETTAPRCSPNNPCHSDLPDSWQD